MKEHLDKHKLSNGMVLLGERMEAVESAAFGFMLPAGAAFLPEGCCGAANVIADWIFRGAGERDNRQLGDALDGLGLHRSAGVNTAISQSEQRWSRATCRRRLSCMAILF